ncbi:hypothetical protein ACHAXA_010390 [Cyclostephanos tholiformis]|uniref:dUTP diphosphatase n=1 Tax=Cyclostephanos tholiformis TaxID=382380 RepID=A0ABD3RAA6_9STRA
MSATTTMTTTMMPDSGDDECLRVKFLSDRATMPSRGSPHSAGFDLSAAERTVVPSGGRAIVRTDLSIACPSGTYARIAPRSGLAVKHMIDTGAGVVDADYRGPVGVVLFNFGPTDFVVEAGDRIAQLILEKVSMVHAVRVDELSDTVRGEGGFGSTGVSARDETEKEGPKKKVQKRAVVSPTNGCGSGEGEAASHQDLVAAVVEGIVADGINLRVCEYVINPIVLRRTVPASSEDDDGGGGGGGKRESYVPEYTGVTCLMGCARVPFIRGICFLSSVTTRGGRDDGKPDDVDDDENDDENNHQPRLEEVVFQIYFPSPIERPDQWRTLTPNEARDECRMLADRLRTDGWDEMFLAPLESSTLSGVLRVGIRNRVALDSWHVGGGRGDGDVAGEGGNAAMGGKNENVGPAVLLGDAAHPPVPYIGQGAMLGLVARVGTLGIHAQYRMPPTRRGAGDRNIVGDVEHARSAAPSNHGAAAPPRHAEAASLQNLSVSPVEGTSETACDCAEPYGVGRWDVTSERQGAQGEHVPIVLGVIKLGGGEGNMSKINQSGGISRPRDGIKPFHLVAPLDNIAINKCPRWGGGNRPGDRVAASFLGWGKLIFLGLGGGRIFVAFRDDAME